MLLIPENLITCKKKRLFTSSGKALVSPLS